MPDNLTREQRIHTMRSVKSQNTKIEILMRNLLEEYGVSNFSSDNQDVFGRPDFTIRDSQVAIFVDGCFWHGCPNCKRPLPVSNHAYWENKIRHTMERDKYYLEQLTLSGWAVIRIWEHSLKSNDGKLESIKLIIDTINSRRLIT